MSKEVSSIHDFDFNLIAEYFAGMQRQGPGSKANTLQALSYIDHLLPDSRIADLGCGSGSQTMVLAQHTPGHITAIDLFPVFIDQLNAQARQLNLQHKVKGIVGSMDDLPFEQEALDLIWSEGAIYNIGFQRGLQEWRQYLKTGGYLAVSEATWFTEERPAEIDAFWQDAYPEIDTVANKVSQMQKAGYVPVAAFVVPENCWTEHFYAPQAAVQEAFLKKHAGNAAVKSFIDNQRHEEQLYYKYKSFYGYAFYIGKKL